MISIGLASFIYFSFPFFGYIGERVSRYKIIMAGTIMTVVGYSLYLGSFLLNDITNKTEEVKLLTFIIGNVAFLPALCGYGLCYANVLQFGTTQLQFAPSNELAAFARWTVFASLLSGLLPQILVIINYQDYHFYLEIVCALHFIIIITFSVLGCLMKNHLNLDSPPQIGPVQLIWKVVRFAWKHRFPLRPSAFTFSDSPPSRLDLAKERYGGPFTTQQVEDVKSFWYLIPIPLSHFLNSALFFSGVPAYQYLTCLEKMIIGPLKRITLQFPIAISEATAILCIGIFQLVIVPCCSRYNHIPNLLKRMWIGLFFSLLSAISVAVIGYNFITNFTEKNLTFEATNTTSVCQDVWPYYVLLVPEILSGVGLFFSLTSQFEFILAQAPQSMQGILVGMTYLEFVFPYLAYFIGIATTLGTNIFYFAFIVGLQMISMLLYSLIACKYRYRQPNEIADINVQVIIEEIFTRELEKEERDMHHTSSTHKSYM